jgi:hypothetical protein
VALNASACSTGEQDDSATLPAGEEPAAGESVAPVVAIVLGNEIRSTDPDVVSEEILTRLFGRYRDDNGLEAGDAEVDAFVADMQEKMADDPNFTANDNLAPAERAQADEMRRQMARSMITRWKVNRAMYREYGGRVIGQQLGPEPLDAYRQFLEAQESAGNFVINDPAMEQSFWRYFRDDSMHSFLDPEEADAVFAEPPWE